MTTTNSPAGTATGTAPATATEELGSSAQRERRKRILDATIGLASQGGFDAVQMRAVADRAEVALGTLYRYFPSKIHLLVSALGREFEKAEGALRGREIAGDTPAERGIEVDMAEIDLMGGENRKEAYLKINPAGQLPALILQDGTFKVTFFYVLSVLDYDTHLF